MKLAIALAVVTISSTASLEAADERSELTSQPVLINRRATPEPRLQFYGVTRARASATLRSLVTGTIAKVHVHEGKLVKAGDALVSLDDRLARSRVRIAEVEAARMGDLKRAQVQLRLAERLHERMKGAIKSNAISAFELEEQEARVEQARALVATQQEAKQLAEANRSLVLEQHRSLTLFAPFDGIVTELHSKMGDSVDSTVPVVSMANLDTLEVELHTPTELYGRFRPHEKIRLIAGPPVNETVSADVIFASPIINSASNTFRCVVRIDNAARKLPAGFSVTLASEYERSSRSSDDSVAGSQSHRHQIDGISRGD